TRRVVAIDLRGHGASDAPRQEYTIEGFADDIAWQCAQLNLQRPIVIGHSFGGAVALELCGNYPELASGLIMIDSIVMPRNELRDSPEVGQLLQGIGGPNYLSVSRANAWDIGCDYDDPIRRLAIFDEFILPPCESTPQHVAFSAIRNAMDHDMEPA